MIKRLSVLVLHFIITINIFSQTGWFWQNPQPQGNNIMAVKMFDADNGIFVNEDNILKTGNGGQGWEVTYTGFPWFNKSISIVNENLYYMLADTAALIKSTDKGRTWSYVSAIPDEANLYIYFKDELTGFALKYSANGSKLHRSTNGGLNWANVITDELSYITSVRFVNPQTGFAAGKKSTSPPKTIIYKTNDGGLSWDTVANNYKLQSAWLYFVNQTTGYLFGQESGLVGRTYVTTNSGQSWNVYSQMNTVVLYSMQFLDDQTGFALAHNRIYRTVNGGISWTSPGILVNNTAYNPGTVNFINSETGYAGGADGVILKTTDAGTSWSKIAGNNFLNDKFRYVSFSDNNTGFIIGYDNKMIRTTNGGSNWQILQFYESFAFSAMSFVNSGTWYISSENGKILKTTDAGDTWDTTYANVYNPTRLEFVNQHTGFGVCKYNDFIKTTNGGANWIKTSPFSAQNWAMDFINENTGFAGNDGGNLYKTTDAGNSWSRIDPLPNGFYINDIQFINNNTGYIATGYSTAPYKGVLKTTNGGITWQPSLQDAPVINDIHFTNERTGFAINYYKELYKTTDAGSSWNFVRTCANENLSAIHFSDSLTGWIVGYNGTILKTTNGGSAVHFEPPAEIPTSFYLFQNYPNPFNPVTTIRYGLPNTSLVSLKVYDILGRLVTQLVSGEQGAGNYTFTFNGSEYASGVYFITLETPAFIQSKKMILLK